jgi:lipopolysaccharide export system protein LptC
MTASQMALSASWDHRAARRGPVDKHERQRLFQAARRHSRLVRRLRVGLPLAGIAIVAIFVVATHFALPGNLDLSVANLSVTRNSIIMDNPHLTGFDADEREYSVQADRAIQALTNPDRVRLETIEANVSVPGQGTAKITADAGEYDNKESTLRLEGGIAVDSSSGYALRMDGADIDLRGGTMSSSNPVSVRYQDSETTGQTISVTGGGRIITLQGNVRTTLMPPKRDAAPDALED